MTRYAGLALLLAVALVVSWVGPAARCDSHGGQASGKGPNNGRARLSGAVDEQRYSTVEFVVIGKSGLRHWELEIRLNDLSTVELWDNAWASLFEFADHDGDGELLREEAKLLPRPFAFRQMQWGKFLSSPNAAPAWEDLDIDSSGAVTRSELMNAYVRAGLGTSLVAFAQPPYTEALTAALCDELGLVASGPAASPGEAADAKPGVADEAHWRQAVDKLFALDANNDELISPGELVDGCTYPGLSATQLLSAANRNAEAATVETPLPLILLPALRSDTDWAGVVIERLDQDKDLQLSPKELGVAPEGIAELDANADGRLSAEELIRWRDSAADLTLRVTLEGEENGKIQVVSESDTKAAATPPLTELKRWQDAGLNVCFRTDPGKLSSTWHEARENFLAQFDEADSAAPDGVSAEALAPFRHLIAVRRLVPLADRNQDGTLTRQELEAWLDLQEAFVAAQSLITIMDHRAGLFEFIDTNADGSLSKPELLGAYARLTDQGILSSRQLRVSLLPRQLRCTLSAGLPLTTLATRPAVGPPWFRSADRNQDGRLSAAEFLGPADAFARIDIDGDGYLSLEEAQATDK